MDPIIVTFVVLIFLLIISLPIGVSLGVAVLAGVWIGDIPFGFFTQKLFNNFDSFPLMAVPFFVLAGEIMQRGTLANSLLGLCRSTCGHLRGGLAHISILTCLFYGALCGSAAATTAAVGGTMIPAMENDNYPKNFSTAVSAAGGCLGVMIPPSIPLILYGAFAGVSISDLFMAGIVPGFLVAVSFMIVAGIICHKNSYGTILPKSSYEERWNAFKIAVPALGVPVIVLGGIYGGIVTPTEAGVVAVIYASLVEWLVSKSLTFAKCKEILISSMRTLGMIFLVIIMANALGTFLLYYNVQELLLNGMREFTNSPSVFLLLMLVIFLILGTFVEATAIILILTPILAPMAASYGINLIHFGIFMLVSLCVGFLTPPVGTNLFVGCAVSGVNIMSLSKAIIPFILAMVVCILVIAFVPNMVLFVL